MSFVELAFRDIIVWIILGITTIYRHVLQSHFRRSISLALQLIHHIILHSLLCFYCSLSLLRLGYQWIDFIVVGLIHHVII